MSEIYLSLCKVRALVGCMDDALTEALTDNPSEAGERALCLVDLLVEHVDTIVRMMEPGPQISVIQKAPIAPPPRSRPS